MAKTANLKGVITLDSSPFFKGINRAMAFAKAASKQFAAHPFKTTAIVAVKTGGLLAKGISTGITKAVGVGVTAFKYLGVGALAAAAAIGAGTVKAFNLGGEMLDLSQRTGVAVGRLLVLRRALGDAGVEADEVGAVVNKMQKFLAAAADPASKEAGAIGELHLSLSALSQLSPDEQLEAIGKAIGGLQDPTQKSALAMAVFGKSGGKLLSFFSDLRNGGLQSAADVIGKQAGILEKNTLIFDKVSDQLGHVGDKLQGFFVGVADRVALTLSPLLDKLDKIDLAEAGQKFGDGVVAGVQAIVGAFQDPKQFTTFLIDAFTAGVLAAGNVLIAVFKVGLAFFKNGLADSIEALGDVILGVLTKAFEPVIARFQAGIEFAIQQLPSVLTGIEYRDDKHAGLHEGNIKDATAERDKIAKDLKAGKRGQFGDYEGSLIREPGTIVALNKQIAESKRILAAEMAKPKKGTIDELTADHLRNRARIQIGEESLTPDEVIARGKAKSRTAVDGASAAIGSYKYEDVLGSGAYVTSMQRNFEKLRKKGEETMPKPESILKNPDGSDMQISDSYKKQLIGIFGKRGAYKTIYGDAVGEKMFQEERPKLKDIDRTNLIGKYGRAYVENYEKNGDLRNLANPLDAPVSPNLPGNGRRGGSVPVAPFPGTRGGLGVDPDATRRIGGLGGIDSATSTVTSGFNGNAFYNATGQIHGFSSMRRMKDDFDKAGVGKKDPALAAQEATAKNTANIAKQLGTTGTEE